MAEAAKAVLEQEKLTVVAYRSYSNGEQLTRCSQAGITAFIPPNRAINNQGDGRFFQKSDFAFDAEQDCYRCPAGETLQRKQVINKDRLTIYTTTACLGCPPCGSNVRKPDNVLSVAISMSLSSSRPKRAVRLTRRS